VHGNHLEYHTIVKPGDFFYIPADIPHLPYNPSKTDPVVAIIARTALSMGVRLPY
jgi:uncharacterized RmlC-like cupin family protein